MTNLEGMQFRQLHYCLYVPPRTTALKIANEIGYNPDTGLSNDRGEVWRRFNQALGQDPAPVYGGPLEDLVRVEMRGGLPYFRYITGGSSFQLVVNGDKVELMDTKPDEPIKYGEGYIRETNGIVTIEAVTRRTEPHCREDIGIVPLVEQFIFLRTVQRGYVKLDLLIKDAVYDEFIARLSAWYKSEEGQKEIRRLFDREMDSQEGIRKKGIMREETTRGLFPNLPQGTLPNYSDGADRALFGTIRREVGLEREPFRIEELAVPHYSLTDAEAGYVANFLGCPNNKAEFCYSVLRFLSGKENARPNHLRASVLGTSVGQLRTLISNVVTNPRLYNLGIY